jgi:ABC-type dipeptide/oligopeptide/nickel transport system permease component
MPRFVLARLLQAVPSLLGVTLAAFILLQLSGDVSEVLLPPQADEATRAQFRQAYGLDQPIPLQYLRYLSHLARGDFGRSFAYSQPAMQVVLNRLPATLELSGAAILLAVLIALPAGIISAVKRGSLVDRLAIGFVLLAQSVPTFWLGMLLILVFAVHFRVLPVSGRGTPAQLVLPGITLALWLLALLARLTRSGMLEVLSQDYVRTARAKGLSEPKVVGGHAFRNALNPIITVFGLQLGGLIGGAILTETVFAWPGIGTLMMDSILKRDYPVVLAGLIMVAVAFVIINLAVDVIYRYLDRRVALA